MSKIKHKPFIYESNIKNISNNNNYISENFKTKITNSKEEFLNKTIKKKLGEEHPFDYSIIEDLQKKFAIISAIIDKIHDFTIGPGIRIESDNKQLIEILEKWMKKTKFKSKLGSWFKEALAKGSSYLEIAGLTDRTKEDMVKNVNPGTIFIKRNDFGEIIEYNQFLGDNIMRIEDSDITKINRNEIIQLDINKIGSCIYGFGIVFSGLGIINDLLQSRKSAHDITERKANPQLHVKLGDSDKEDYPEQADIDAFGSKLQFMNDTTEWVTGPNVEMNVIEYGDIADKFISLIENDLKLLSYSFQVPEVILGASQAGGLNASGQSNIQMDAFERNINSYQEQLSFVIITKIFDIVLANEGMVNIDYEIIWGQQNEEDKNLLRQSYKEILAANTQISPGMRIAYEKKLSILDDIDMDEVEKENKRMERRDRQDDNKNFQRQLQLKNTDNKKLAEEKIRDIIKDKLESDKSPQEIELEISKEIKNEFELNIYDLIMDEVKEWN